MVTFFGSHVAGADVGLILKILGGFVALVVLAAVAAYVLLWARPINVNAYINKATMQLSLDSPELLTSLGFIDNTPLDFHSGKLADYTKAQEEKSLAKLRRAREGLNRYGPDGLDGQELLSWRVAAWFFDDIIRQAEFEVGGYRLNQMTGVTVNLPNFLTSTHVIVSKKSAERYVSRVNEFGRVLRETLVRLEADRAAGVTPPDFVIEKSLTGMRAFIKGGAAENTLVNSLEERLADVDGVSDATRDKLVDAAREAVANEVIPGYEAIIGFFEDALKTADHDAGIWRIPNGEAIYEAALKSNTTTDLSADAIHNIGLQEVDRIEAEMDAILVSTGREEGTVAERVQALMTDPEQLFPNDDEGRKAMIAYLVELDNELMAKAPDYFATLPEAPLSIERVPEFSQDGAPGGYYQQPAFDGSRPGKFFINQKDTADNPKWTLPTLMYHEGAPGHHFQISIAQGIEGVPLLRKVGLFTAYTEGWALYAERIASLDMGMYDDDPLGDLGRLQAEMFRAVRLVVDTGIHDKRWSREEAIEYMASKTGMTEAEVTREIERYAVIPGQATAYKTGQLAMIRLRERAETALGDDFYIRAFHDVILLNGALPLALLEQVVDDWIAEQGGAA
ncbi:MAG: DUF885 family protein [Parvularculaceae bacterium]